MLFNSYPFLLVFLPLAVGGFILLNSWAGKWAALNFITLASLVFYSYWNPPYTLLIVGSIALNFLLGRHLYRSADGRKIWLTVGIVVNLGALGYFKYSHFGAEVLGAFTGLDLRLAEGFLPLAMSFFTFTQIAYLVDVYRGMRTEYSLREYCFFVLFFPHLIAGPIVRHYEILPQLEGRKLEFRLELFAAGLTVLAIGLSKKVFLADMVSPTAASTFALVHKGVPVHFFLAWIGALAYACQIYFDFSGYSDMALGLGLMFGIRLPLNFNSPYKAASIIDFWRRWHISLSRFLRDYLYIPLGGGRVAPWRKYANLFSTMLLGGLWHGAGWTFILWGGVHGFFLMVNHGWIALTRDRSWAQGRLMRVFYRVVTFVSVVAAWVLFRAERLSDAVLLLRGMAGQTGVLLPHFFGNLFGVHLPVWLNSGSGEFGIGDRAIVRIVIFLVVAFFAPNTQQIMARANPALEEAEGLAPTPLRWSLTPSWACAVGLLWALILCSLNEVSEFIYFQF